jgi:two-component system, chemotaxis family, CheB/CheR fusion protein
MAKKPRKGSSDLPDEPAKTPSDQPAETEAEPTAESMPSPVLNFPVVGVGASAGGVDAFRRFLSVLPANTGMAFVLIQHLDPNHESLMAGLLAHHTKMSVQQVEGRTAVKPNCVYAIPPGKYLILTNQYLHLTEPTEVRGRRMPIDAFFKSLADAQREKAICVILSGTGSDGSSGLRSIKANGGLVVAQDPEEAQQDGMPRSAIATGLVDLILPAGEAAQTLMQYASHPYVSQEAEAQAVPSKDTLETIFSILHTRVGHEFRGYKQNMLRRRIQRRMGLNHVENIHDYIKLLRAEEKEVNALFRDLLIGVTEFFREPDAWDEMRKLVVPRLIETCGPGNPLRVWVPGCASGEEAYSVAMLLLEAIELAGKRCEIQIFATDIDREAIARARAGVYTENVTSEVSPERLKRFFTHVEERYQVNKNVRECVLFSPQNVLSDPPFSKLDLITCRNLLIYLQNNVQKKIIRLFHFGLKERGFLFLGASETIGTETDLFNAISKKWRIHQKVGISQPGRVDVPVVSMPEAVPAGEAMGARSRHRFDRSRVAQELLLEEFAPASVLVDRKHQVVYYHGEVRKYLDFPAGEPTIDLLSIAMEGLRMRLRAAVHLALTEGRKVTMDAGKTRREDGRLHPVRITVVPLHEPSEIEGHLLVSFEDIPEEEAGRTAAPSTQVPPETDQDVVRQIEYELKSTREELESTIEEMETSNEELKASNEEVMSMNEELQSTNEELETSKEELQSLNEELNTVNNELREKVDELERVNDDTTNLLTSTDVATVFLDRQFRVKRYTPSVNELFSLIPTDVGRPISDVAMRFNDKELYPDCERVLQRLQPAEQEIQSESGSWFIRRVLPYRTQDDRIGGVVVTFTNITGVRTADIALNLAEERLRLALEGARIGTWEYGPGARQYSADALSSMALQGHPPEQPFTYEDWVQRLHPEDRDRVVTALKQCLSKEGSDAYDDEYRVVWPDESTHWVASRGRAYFDMVAGSQRARRVMGVIQDITERRQIQYQLEHYREDLESQVRDRTILAQDRADQLARLTAELTETEQRERRRLASTLHDSLQQLIAAATMRLELAGRKVKESDVKISLKEVRDLLRQATEEARSLTVELSPHVLYDGGLVLALEWLAEWVGKNHKLTVNLDIQTDRLPAGNEMAILLFDAVRELLFNVVKHAGVAEATIAVRPVGDDQLEVIVSDQGKGFDPAMLKDRSFMKGDHYGLFSIRERIELLGGTSTIESAPGKGTTVHLIIPAGTQKPQAGMKAIPLPVARPTSAGVHILLVDDHQIARQGLCRLLEDQGDMIIVGEAANGREAIDAARRLNPDVILMDINMPEMNGIEATKIIAQEMPHICIIGLSVYGNTAHMNEAMTEAGASGYLSKDSPVEDIVKTIRQCAIKRP